MMRPDEMLEQFIAIPSPTRREADATNWLLARARADGLDADIDAVGNVVATAGSGPLHILFVGHIDVVEPHLPVRRDEGRLWGRGTVDAKGCLVAAYHATLACRGRDDVRFTFAAAVGEESDSRGTLGLEVDAPDLIINGEPSGWAGITVGYKGILRGAFGATGEPRHGGHPDPNVLDRVVAWWAQVCSRLDAATGFEHVQAHLDHLDHRRDVVEKVDGRFQIRVPPGTPTSAVRDALDAAGQAFAVDVDVEEALEASVSSPRSALVAAFRTAIRAHGGTPRILHKTGTSDFNHLAVRFPDVPIIAYGPGDSSLDHTPDEHIELAELERSVGVWITAIEQVVAPRMAA